VGELSVYYCAVHSGRRFRLRLDVKDWQDSGDVLEAVYFLLYAYMSGGGGAREGLYVPDSGSFECRRDHFERSAMNRDVAWNPTPLEQCVICSGIVAQKASLIRLLRPLRGVIGEGLDEMSSSPKRI
jgi:hypothetical protein